MTLQNIAADHPDQLFHDFLSAHNHPVDGQINCDTSQFHSIKCPHGSKTDARYKFYSDGIASGYFKCWHCGVDDSFCCKKKHEVTPQEWQSHQDRLAADKLQNQIEMQQQHTEVAKLAKAVFAMADPHKATEHGYLKLKQSQNYGLKVIVSQDENTKQAKCYKDTLLVPCHNASGELMNIERIYYDEKEGKYQKRPLTGGVRNGAFYMIGEVTDKPAVIQMSEGYSSAAIAHEATGLPTVVTFNCGNIVNVATIIRATYPQAHLVIIADDDKWHSDPKLRHAGLKSAKKACGVVKNTTYILPDFTVLGLPDKLLKESKPTDINDLFVHLMKKGLNRIETLDIVRHQLTYKPALHREILNELIKKSTRVNFMKLADLPEDAKPSKHHYLIIAIDQILELATTSNWGICKNHEFIYLYNGEYWDVVDLEELRTFLGMAAESMGVPKFIARFFQFREQLYNQFMAMANLPKPEQLEHTILINLKNGTFAIAVDGVRLNDNRLNDFNRADFMTYQLPFNYDKEAMAPQFQSYLDKVLPENKLQHILAEYIAYVFVQPSTLKLEKTLLLYGTGANGKSVFYEIVRSLLGEQNTSEYSLQSLTNNTGYFRAMIANKLVNYASEINGKLEASIFKQLVSGEPVEARLPYGRPFTLKRYAKLIFNCNELPKDVEQTEAYFRRFLIIPFDVRIPDAEQDKQLAQKIIATELSGVFNWVLQGLTRLLTQKQFTECETVKFAREQYERESDSVKIFLDEEEYTASTTGYITMKVLYSQYRIFCQDGGFNPVNQLNFKKRLTSSKIIISKKNIGNVAYLSQVSLTSISDQTESEYRNLC